MQEAVRESWLEGMNRECQVLIGETVRSSARPLHAVLLEFADCLPEPRTRVEGALLRGRLLDLCLRWGDAYHRQYHRSSDGSLDSCGLRPNDVVAVAWRDWSTSPRRSFDMWVNAYIRQFSRHHPSDSITVLRDELDRMPMDTGVIHRVALETGLSVRKLRADFERLTGTTPRIYQTKRRVDRAVLLLENTDAKVQTIANDMGWASRKDLLNAVREATGFTPSEIRSQRRRPQDQISAA